MKTMRTINTMTLAVAITLMVALVMTLTLPMKVFAAGDWKLTISPPSSLSIEPGDFTLYKIFSVGGTAENPYYSTNDTATKAFVDWAKVQYGGYSPYGDSVATLIEFLKGSPTPAQLKTLTNDIVKSGKFTPITNAKKEGDDDVSFMFLENGYYLATGKGSPTAGGSKVSAYSSLVTINGKNVQINLKADVPEIGKTVSDENLDPDSEDWGKELISNIGDTVYFKLDSYVPDMTGYDSYTFKIHDIMSKGLTFNASSVVVKLVDPEGKVSDITLVKGTDFTVREDKIASGDSHIVIELENFIENKKYTGYSIVATYNAKLNQDAVSAPTSNPNDVYLEYSNNPYTFETGETPTDGVDIYTFDINIIKIDGDTKAVLKGAEFELWAVSGDWTSAIKFSPYKENDVVKAGEYVFDSTGGSTTLVSPVSGKIHIKGLLPGMYYLHETKAPEGYNKLPAETPIEISYTTDGGTIVYPTAEITVENNNGKELPGTGGIGTTIFYIVSAFLTAGLVIFFIVRKRMSILNVK